MAPRRTEASIPAHVSFWTLQAIGWTLFAGAMIVSRVGVLPMSYMLAMKGLLTLTGFFASLALWRLYRRWGTPHGSPYRILLLVVTASYACAMLWTLGYHGVVRLIGEPLWSLFAGAPRRFSNRAPWLDGVVYNALALLAWSMLYFGIRFQRAAQLAREHALRAEAEYHDAQLRALRYQLNPHFLFNTLNAISTLVVDHRADDAARMIARLSGFLRLTLAGDMTAEITLEQELRFVREYLEIEQIRFGARLRIELTVPDDLLPSLVPALILQPIIENAMKYAVAPRVEGATIAICITRSADDLVIVVSDDGPGVRHPDAGTTAQVGLANTRLRLAHSYGGDGRLGVGASPPGGCAVTLRIPFHVQATVTRRRAAEGPE